MLFITTIVDIGYFTCCCNNRRRRIYT